MDADLLIRGGTLADGLGGPLRLADVAVVAGRIAAVGALSGWRGKEEIDARGLLVTPGFVDIHTHYDGQATWENHLSPSTAHGVTTVVMGNCGVGFAPCRAADRADLVHLMEGIEDLPEVVLATGLRWNWESFPEYLDVLAGRQFDADIGTQIPHAALRVHVMGERAMAREAATPADRAEMAALAGEAIEAGALGFATSRTLNHLSSDGRHVPTLGAAEAELQALAGALQAKGRGVLQAVSDFADEEAELRMFRRVLEKSGRPLSLSVLQWHHAGDKWRRVMDWMRACNAAGLEVRAQVCARPVGMLLGFELSYNPFMFSETWKSLLPLSRGERLAALRREEVRARILSEEFVDETPLQLLRHFEGMYPLGAEPDYEPAPGSDVASQAKRLGVEPAALAYDLMLEQGGEAVLMLPSVNYADGNLEAARELWQHPASVAGLGDGGAHLGIMCDSSLPTFMLQYWGRERPHGRLPLEALVRDLTAKPAAAVGLLDRGVLAAGKKADINVIDAAGLTLGPPRMRYDLPAGGRRLVQAARGYRATVVSGVVVRRGDVATGALPGRLVRGPRAA